MINRCKMKCVSEGKVAWGQSSSHYNYKFQPVYGSDGESPENKAFWEATPSGSLELTCVKQHNFEAGKSYYIDISEA